MPAMSAGPNIKSSNGAAAMKGSAPRQNASLSGLLRISFKSQLMLRQRERNVRAIWTAAHERTVNAAASVANLTMSEPIRSAAKQMNEQKKKKATPA